MKCLSPLNILAYETSGQPFRCLSWSRCESQHWKTEVLGPGLLSLLAYVFCALGQPCIVIDVRPHEQHFQSLGESLQLRTGFRFSSGTKLLPVHYCCMVADGNFKVSQTQAECRHHLGTEARSLVSYIMVRSDCWRLAGSCVPGWHSEPWSDKSFALTACDFPHCCDQPGGRMKRDDEGCFYLQNPRPAAKLSSVQFHK